MSGNYLQPVPPVGQTTKFKMPRFPGLKMCISEAALAASPRPACAYCQCLNNLKRCHRCYAVWYCDERCQKWDWKCGHKDMCKEGTPQEPCQASAQRHPNWVSLKRDLLFGRI